MNTANLSSNTLGNTLSIYEAKTHFSALAGRVAAGEAFTVTRHGKPLLKLVPVVKEEQSIRSLRIQSGISLLRKLKNELNKPILSREEVSLYKDEDKKW